MTLIIAIILCCRFQFVWILFIIFEFRKMRRYCFSCVRGWFLSIISIILTSFQKIQDIWVIIISRTLLYVFRNKIITVITINPFWFLFWFYNLWRSFWFIRDKHSFFHERRRLIFSYMIMSWGIIIIYSPRKYLLVSFFAIIIIRLQIRE